MTEFPLLCKRLFLLRVRAQLGFYWVSFSIFKGNMTAYKMYMANVLFYTKTHWMIGQVKSRSVSHVNLKSAARIIYKSFVKSRCEF